MHRIASCAESLKLSRLSSCVCTHELCQLCLLQASPAAVFAHKRKQERQPGPGDSVGQSLVTCTPQDTFSTVSVLHRFQGLGFAHASL